jgi:hypothetical protein
MAGPRTRLDDLPLFADDRALGAALLGPRRSGEWRQIASLLEARGLPKIDTLMGGRYVPAVKAFFDGEMGLKARAPLAPDGVEDLGGWRRRKLRA